MASAIQSKHHARLHAVVLRKLYPSPPKTGATALDQAHSGSLNLFAAEELSRGQEQDDDVVSTMEDVDAIVNTRCPMSRAQRKRLKSRREKEDALHTQDSNKRFIGPLWQDHNLIKFTSHCTGRDDVVSEALNMEHHSPEISRKNGAVEGENEVVDGTSGTRPSVSRVKMRRLAKKNYQRHLSAPVFTANFDGSNIIVRQVTSDASKDEKDSKL